MKAAIWFYALALTIFLVAPVAAQEEGPSILTVDDNPGMDFTTIQSAINAAQPGDIVEVSSGTYTESLVIDKALTLRAAEGANVILSDSSSAEADGILIGCECFALGNVTIEGITIDYDQIGNDGIRAVVVDVLTLRNLVISANGDGVSAWDAGGIVVENVDVLGSGADGLMLVSDGNISVTGSSVTDAGDFGIRAFAPNVTVADSEASDVDAAALWIIAENATITGNTLTGVGNGIVGSISGNATVNDNVITDSENQGIFLGSSDSVDGNITVTNNLIGPVALDGEGTGILLEFNDEDAVIGLLVQGNSIEGAASDGIWAHSYGPVVISENDVTNVSDGGGIDAYGADLNLTGNAVENVTGDGIYAEAGLTENQVVWISDNFVNGTGGDGIYANGDHIEIHDNLVNDTYGDGIYANAGGDDSVVVSGNDVSHAYGYGIEAYSNGDITIHDNAVNDTYYAGIYASSSFGEVSIESNSVSDAGERGIEAYGDHIDILENVVNGTYDEGIYADASGFLSAVVSGNEVSDTGGAGILAAAALGNVDVENNIVRLTGGDGINANSGLGDTTVHNNIVNSTGGHGISGDSGLGNVFITSNSIVESGEKGIDASGNTVQVRLNEITDTGSDGILIDGLSPFSSVVTGNHVSDAGGDGIDIASMGGIIVHDNIVQSVEDGGIHANSGLGVVSITSNSVSHADGGDGIEAYGFHIEVLDNIVNATEGDGIYADASGPESVIVSGNNVTNAFDGSGINAYSSGAATVQDNLVNSTHEDGIYVEAYEATITGNDVSQVGERGIVLVIESGDGASLTSVSDNFVEAFGLFGIDVQVLEVDAVVSNNTIRYNGELQVTPATIGLFISGSASDVSASGNTIHGAVAIGLYSGSSTSDVELIVNDVTGALIGIFSGGSEVDILSNTVSPIALGIHNVVGGQWNIADNVVSLPAEPGFGFGEEWIAAAVGIVAQTADPETFSEGEVSGNEVRGGNGTAGIFWHTYAYDDGLGSASFHDNTLATQVGFVIEVLFEEEGGVGEYPIRFNDMSGTQVPFGVCGTVAGEAALAMLSESLLSLLCSGVASPAQGDLNGTAPLNYYGHAGPPRNAGDFAPIGVEPFLTAAPDPARTTDNVQTFGYFVHIAGPAEGEAPEAVGLGAPTALARPLNEMFDADFAGVVYEFDAASQSWQQSLGDETLGALEARLVLPLNDTRVLIDFADSLFEVPLSREVQAGWNFQAPRQFSNVDRAFDGGTFRTFEVFDLFGQPEQHVDHDGMIYGFPLGELWEGSPYVALNTFDEACSGPLATPYGGYFTSYLGPQVITSVIPAGVGVDDWQQYVPDLVCVDVDLPGDLPLLTFYQDMDGDGFGTDDMTIEAESQPLGYAAQGGDCNDANPSMNPGASEVPNDTFDNDCDPATLDEVPV